MPSCAKGLFVSLFRLPESCSRPPRERSLLYLAYEGGEVRTHTGAIDSRVRGFQDIVHAGPEDRDRLFARCSWDRNMCLGLGFDDCEASLDKATPWFRYAC